MNKKLKFLLASLLVATVMAVSPINEASAVECFPGNWDFGDRMYCI